MPIYRLTNDLAFPPPHFAEDGLLAVGGDLSQDRLLLAYRGGIFPWYSKGEPILWWSPDPRMILLPGKFHCPASLRRLLNKGVFRFTFNTAFAQVIRNCSKAPRPGQDGTWITSEMEQAYTALHEAGHAHSVECWRGGELVGGLYGVGLGACFFGESMFSKASNASKAALAVFVEQCKRWEIGLIDCQVANAHLYSLGAREIPRDAFLKMLASGLRRQGRRGPWAFDADIVDIFRKKQ